MFGVIYLCLFKLNIILIYPLLITIKMKQETLWKREEKQFVKNIGLPAVLTKKHIPSYRAATKPLTK